MLVAHFSRLIWWDLAKNLGTVYKGVRTLKSLIDKPKNHLAGWLCCRAWLILLYHTGFQAMDSNGNGLLSPREVQEAAMVRRRKNDSKNLSVFLFLHICQRSMISHSRTTARR